MNTEQLKTFLSLAETKSFSRTAEGLNLAQSTVSKRIEELEKEVDERLFTRDRAGAALTGAGMALLGYAEQMVNMEEAAKRQIRRKSQYAGHLTLGTVYAYFDTSLCSMLRSFTEEHSELAVRVNFGHTSSVLADLRRAAVDIAFTHHPFSHPEYTCALAEEDEVVLVTDAGNKAYAAGITHDQIKTLPFLSSNFLYATTYSWLFPRNQQFQLEMELASHAAPFLKNNKWYTLLGKKLIEEELKTGALIEIPVLDAKIPPAQYYRVYRKESTRQAAVRAWLERFE